MLQHLCTCCISRLPSCKEGYVQVLKQSLKYISQFSSFSNVYGYSNSLLLSCFVFDIYNGVNAVFQHWRMFICGIKFGSVAPINLPLN